MFAERTELPKLVAIAAIDDNRTIGLDGKLPWRLPEDLKFFRDTTMGHPVLMGRKTFQSLGKPLKGRRNIVLSRTLESLPGAEVIHKLEDLTELADLGQIVYVIGGAIVYTTILPFCQELILTRINGVFQGDTFFPSSYRSLFKAKQKLQIGDCYSIRRYVRKQGENSVSDDEQSELALDDLCMA